MAITSVNEIKGASLPYVKIGSYNGDKSRISVVTCFQSSKDHQPLHSEVLMLSESDSKEVADKVTGLIYRELKSKGYIHGEDC